MYRVQEKTMNRIRRCIAGKYKNIFKPWYQSPLFYSRMHKLHLCIQLIKAADHVIINIAWSLVQGATPKRRLFAFLMQAQSRVFLVFFVDFGNWFFFCSFFSVTEQKILSKSKPRESEEEKKVLEWFKMDFLLSYFSSKQFLWMIQWLAWYEYMIWWLQAHPRLGISLKPWEFSLRKP